MEFPAGALARSRRNRAETQSSSECRRLLRGGALVRSAHDLDGELACRLSGKVPRTLVPWGRQVQLRRESDATAHVARGSCLILLTTMAEPFAAWPGSQRPTMQSKSPERQREAAGLACLAVAVANAAAVTGPSRPCPRSRPRPLAARSPRRNTHAHCLLWRGAGGMILTLKPLLEAWLAFCGRNVERQQTDSLGTVRRSARGRSALPRPEGRHIPGAGQILVRDCGRDILQLERRAKLEAPERSRDPESCSPCWRWATGRDDPGVSLRREECEGWARANSRGWAAEGRRFEGKRDPQRWEGAPGGTEPACSCARARPLRLPSGPWGRLAARRAGGNRRASIPCNSGRGDARWRWVLGTALDDWASIHLVAAALALLPGAPRDRRSRIKLKSDEAAG